MRAFARSATPRDFDNTGEIQMIRRMLTLAVVALGLVGSLTSTADAGAYGRQWGHSSTTQDWNKFYHYPYVYYPQNYWSSDYFKSSESLYYRYPAEMRIPVYNKAWHNEYPQARRYHQGHHFQLDVF